MQQQIVTAFSPVAISAVVVAIVMAASRLAPFTKPYWTFLPKAVQVLLPSLVAGLPVAVNAFGAVKTWLDFAQALLVVGAIPLALAAPGSRSPHNDPDPPSDTKGSDPDKPTPPTAPVPPLAAAGLLLIGLLVSGCSGLFGPSASYPRDPGVLIADAGNAVSAAEALLPTLHLGADEQASVEALVARARAALAAAAAANDGAADITSEQLDASLAEFRAAWADLQQAFSAKHPAATNADPGLPVPLAVHRAASK
jgi:hypothetical protein